MTMKDHNDFNRFFRELEEEEDTPMVRVPIPLVVKDTFFVSGNAEEGNVIQVSSAAWYNWLSNIENRSFSMHCPAGAFTARHEQQRHGWYWYAYRKMAGKAYKLYLGKAQDVTQQRLYDVATRLAEKGESESQKNATSDIDPQFPETETLPMHASKFSIPLIETPQIARPHLLSKLEAGRKKKLILISAQAGWGKTLLLSNWCTLLSRQKSSFAWISLDSADNTLSTFWNTFINALQLFQPGLGQQASQLLQNGSNMPIERVLQTLLDECISLKKECIFFLDDVHFLTSSVLQQSISFFLEYLPPQLHLVMASRVDPQLSLARLRVQGKLLEIHATDLAFNISEISTLLEDTFHLRLSQQELLLLEQRTEGWPAGVYLAAQLLKDASNDITQTLMHLSGSSYIIRDYFIEEVFLQQPISIQDFLLQTSMLNRLSSQLCNAVCANTNSQARLEYLRQNNLFVIPLDGQGLDYRYHPLFQEALQGWLRQQYPLLERDLQQRAAFWYEQQSTHRQIQTIQEMAKAPIPSLSSTLPVYLLTERERQVLTLLLRGASNREISQDLIISEGTTKKHIANICSKFHVQRRTQVITKMLEQVAI